VLARDVSLRRALGVVYADDTVMRPELEEEYREVGRAVGSKDITLTRRFPFSIAPADLQD
jgi:hypothetical protein